MPIADEVYHVLHEGREPRASVESLMLRGRKDETEDLP
jgi:glycerol-3-phosphate dehydrogenase